MQKKTKTKKIRLALMIWGFLVILIGLIVEAAIVLPQLTPLEAQGQSCTTGAECPPCEYPQVAFCEHSGSANPCGVGAGICTCKGIPQSDPACGAAVCNEISQSQACDPGGCPSGYVDCGISGYRSDNSSECQAFGSCTTRCAACNNPTTFVRFCRQVVVPTPTPTPTPVPTPTPTPPADPDYEIVKDVIDSDNVYEIGETATFSVTIRNTGDVVFNVIAFRDVYNPARLDYLSARGNRNSEADVAISFNVNESTGVVTHSNLAEELGNLSPGDYYQLIFSFRALSRVSRTCNEAFVNPNNLGEEGDDACVAINEIPIPIPDL